MGQYEPNDSRDVTLSPDSVPGEPPKTGPREADARRDAQHGYGNARTEDGAMEQDVATADVAERVVDADRAVVLETSSDPAEQVRADAQPPLYQPSDSR